VNTGSGPSQAVNALDARRRSRGPGCVSTLALDQLALGELPEPARAALLSHLGTCADCARVSAALAEEQTHFLAEVALPTLAAQTLAEAARAPRTMWSRVRRFLMPLAAAGVASAAALAIFVATPGDGARSKGDFSLSTYVLHAERSGPGQSHLGEPLHPGDRLQFRYNGTKPGHLAVVAVDAAGQVSLYFPGGATTAPVAAGRDVPMSSAVELDDSLGPELIIGVRCESVMATEEILAAVRKAAGPRPDLANLPALHLPCAEVRQSIDKRPRP
jgi:hypothetical protein